MLTKLKEMFETNTFQHKIKAKDISLSFKNGEPVFGAIVCIPIRTETAIKKGTYEREYTNRDTEKILKLKEQENEKHPWWKVEIKKDAVRLYYYPMDWMRKRHPDKDINEIYERLDRVEELFTGMVS